VPREAGDLLDRHALSWTSGTRTNDAAHAVSNVSRFPRPCRPSCVRAKQDDKDPKAAEQASRACTSMQAKA
jgi:hypothetical protein